ncbi:MAG: DoxX family membrane protein [Candidatus Paceibacterota bacterium]
MITEITKLLLPTQTEAQTIDNLSTSHVADSLRGDGADHVLAIHQNISDFIFWGFASTTIIAVVLLVSVTQKLEELFDPTLHRIKKFAPFIMQGTLGVALLLSAIFGSLFGAEVPLDAIFSGYAEIIRLVLAVTGGMLLTGILPHLAGLVVIILFVPFIADTGLYALNYATHLGEAMTIFLLGGTYQIMRSNLPLIPKFYRSLELHLHKYKFMIVRIAFGISLIFTAFYTNYLHGNAALETVTSSRIMEIFPFDPTFLVIGVLVVEILLGIFFIIGFEIRFAALTYMIFLVSSIIFFQEVVWSHTILIGACVALFTHGYDRYTIGGSVLKRGNLEPIL